MNDFLGILENESKFSEELDEEKDDNALFVGGTILGISIILAVVVLSYWYFLVFRTN